MRVLTVITSIEPEVGGPSFVAVNAIVAERRLGLETDLASTVPAKGSTRTELADRLVAADAPHYAFPRPRLAEPLMQRWGVSVPLVAWVLRHGRRYDVLHAHYVWSMGTLVAVIVGAIWRKPVVLTPHESLTGFGIATSRSSLRARQKLFMRRLLMRGISAVTVSSELELRDSLIDDASAVLIPHPVEATPEADEHPRVLDASQGLRLGYLGRLHEKKRAGLLIETLARLPAATRLVVGGDQPPSELERLRARSRELGLDDRIDFVGFVRESDREAFFERIDVLVMPSTYECFGMVAAEAMGAGLPVVVSDQTGVASTVDAFDAGLVFPVEATEELERMLRDLSEHPERLGPWSSRAYRAARETFSFEAYARRTSALYARLLGRDQAAPTERSHSNSASSPSGSPT